MGSVLILGRDILPPLIRLGAGESLSLTLAAPAGVSGDYSTRIVLEGPEASLDLAGVFLCNGSEKLSLDIDVRHEAPGCTSEQVFRGIVDGSARVRFDGLVYVAPLAGRTVAHQECRNLLLSPDAVAETLPQLEIYADDVQCSHGATTGFLDPEQLFYMRSRGVPEEEAKQLQMAAFLEPVLRRLGDSQRCLFLSR